MFLSWLPPHHDNVGGEPRQGLVQNGLVEAHSKNTVKAHKNKEGHMHDYGFEVKATLAAYALPRNVLAPCGLLERMQEERSITLNVCKR